MKEEEHKPALSFFIQSIRFLPHAKAAGWLWQALFLLLIHSSFALVNTMSRISASYIATQITRGRHAASDLVLRMRMPLDLSETFARAPPSALVLQSFCKICTELATYVLPQTYDLRR